MYYAIYTYYIIDYLAGKPDGVYNVQYDIFTNYHFDGVHLIYDARSKQDFDFVAFKFVSHTSHRTRIHTIFS